jgi:DNA-binding CsgD family transcriptional regulator
MINRILVLEPENLLTQKDHLAARSELSELKAKCLNKILEPGQSSDLLSSLINQDDEFNLQELDYLDKNNFQIHENQKTNLREFILLAQTWRSHLKIDCSQQNAATRESIVRWLLGKDLEQLATLDPTQLKIAQQAMEYRYRILRYRYLGLGPEQAYRNLTKRLSSSILLRNKIRTCIALSRDCQRAVVDILQEVLQELLQCDRYIQQQMAWIAECTSDAKLRSALLFASVEEYCLRPIRNQPLLVYRFVNYLRRVQRGGFTQVPNDNTVRLISEEILQDDSDNPLSLLDTQATAAYKDGQALAEQQALRQQVQQEFSHYLASQLGAIAVQWLQLYLQGKSQKVIARALNLSVKEVYRLREKISYHAVQVFAVKSQSELVGKWLETSLLEYNFGLTAQQWQRFWQQLTPLQRRVIELSQASKDLKAIAQILNCKTHQIMSEWSKLYLTAQAIRNRE